MDMFMDKLAQKLTAQEIIKANTAADAEELNRLRDRLEEYNECLTRLQKLLDEGEERAGKRTDELQGIRSSMDGFQQSIDDLRQSTGGFQQSMEGFQQSMEGVQQSMDGFQQSIEEQNVQALLPRLEAMEDNTHKECVKVYRNVQAALAEESGRLGEETRKVTEAVEKLKGRLGAVLGVSVAALLFSLAGVVIQILGILHIITF